MKYDICPAQFFKVMGIVYEKVIARKSLEGVISYDEGIINYNKFAYPFMNKLMLMTAFAYCNCDSFCKPLLDRYMTTKERRQLAEQLKNDLDKYILLNEKGK